MNKSTRTINIFLENYVKKIRKHTINLYLKIVKMTDTHMANNERNHGEK